MEVFQKKEHEEKVGKISLIKPRKYKTKTITKIEKFPSTVTLTI